MANEEHVRVVKRGRDAIAEWRKENPEERLELDGAELSRVYLRGANIDDANLNRANLSRARLCDASLADANLSSANLSSADLSHSNLSRADLDEADLSDASLFGAVFNGADLSRANLSNADLGGADLSSANLREAVLFRAVLKGAKLLDARLSGANLSGARLIGANLSEADLRDASLRDAKLWDTVFYKCDFSQVKGLNGCHHLGSSSVSFETQATIPATVREHFLRGCGLPEIYLEQLPALIGSLSPIDFYSAFLSHNHDDKEFVRRLHNDLQAEGVRCWLDEKEMVLGEKLEVGIDRGVKSSDKIILCCSEFSLHSWWVDIEVKKALDRERRTGQVCLIPLVVDGYLFSDDCQYPWAEELRGRLCGDFKEWKHEDKYQPELKRLLKALQQAAERERAETKPVLDGEGT